MSLDDLTFSPIKRQNLISFYHDLCSMTWFPHEIDLSKDRHQFAEQPKELQQFVQIILAFFAPADGLICENLMSRFIEDTSVYKEAKFFYAVQNFNETIHNETYSQLIDVFFSDDAEKKRTLESVHEFPCVKNIALWMRKWMDAKEPLENRIFAFACIEGGLFNGAFAAIYWLKQKNVLVGLTQANEFIARDEAVHTKFAAELYKTMVMDKLIAPLNKTKMLEIMNEAVELSINLTNDALKVDLIGLTKQGMSDYIKCTFDNLSVMFGFDKVYNTPSLDFMLLIGLEVKTNFFERPNTNYSRGTEQIEFDENANF